MIISYNDRVLIIDDEESIIDLAGDIADDNNIHLDFRRDIGQTMVDNMRKILNLDSYRYILLDNETKGVMTGLDFIYNLRSEMKQRVIPISAVEENNLLMIEYGANETIFGKERLFEIFEFIKREVRGDFD